jgi:hypothetical protein
VRRAAVRRRRRAGPGRLEALARAAADNPFRSGFFLWLDPSLCELSHDICAFQLLSAARCGRRQLSFALRALDAPPDTVPLISGDAVHVTGAYEGCRASLARGEPEPRALYEAYLRNRSQCAPFLCRDGDVLANYARESCAPDEESPRDGSLPLADSPPEKTPPSGRGF